jgi:hypothetical protein
MLRHFTIWILLVILTPLVLPILASPNALQIYIRNDYHNAIKILGDKEAIDEQLINLYKKNLEKVAEVADTFRDSHDDSNKFRNNGDRIGESIADMPANVANAVKLQAYSMALRIVILAKWSPWLIAPMTMAILAGFLKRNTSTKPSAHPPLQPIILQFMHSSPWAS